MDGFLQMTLTAAFLAGLSGGVHCAAMCGPLIGIACGPCARGSARPWFTQALAYNAGRITSYIAAGVIVATAGAAGLALRGAPVMQQSLLLAMSASLILLAAYVAGVAPFVRVLERAGAAGWRHIEPWGRRFLPVNTPARAFGIGLVLGWLPCGMVYVALIAALATADPLHGAMVMAAFGLGTLPNVLAISAWFTRVMAVAKSRLARVLVAAVIAALGLFGLLKAAHPSIVTAAGQWCLEIPGMAAVLGFNGT